MATADFAIVQFNEHLGDDPGDLNVPEFEFVGNQTSLKHFSIPGEPTAAGYILIQAGDVQNKGHKILVNGIDLPGTDINRTREARWQDTFDVIPAGILSQGNNTIQIQRAGGGDNILIGYVMIHWKQSLKVEEAQHATHANEAIHAMTATEADHAKTADKLSPPTVGNGDELVEAVWYRDLVP